MTSNADAFSPRSAREFCRLAQGKGRAGIGPGHHAASWRVVFDAGGDSAARVLGADAIGVFDLPVILVYSAKMRPRDRIA